MARPSLTTAEFEELYRRTAPEVHGYLRRRVGDAALDLLSEVYVVAWSRRGDLPAEWLHRAWLFGVARRLLLSHHRTTRRAAAAEAEAGLAPRADPAAPADHDGQADQRAAAVRAALASLGEGNQELIRLTEWEGLTIAEAAVTLGLKPGTARVRLHRARQRLAADPLLRALVGGRQEPHPDLREGITVDRLEA